MVCIRCKMFVNNKLTELGLPFSKIEMGRVDIIGDITTSQHDQIRADLLDSGLELIVDIKSILVEKIKRSIIEIVHYAEYPLPIKLSAYLAEELHHNYTYMANTFSERQGHSIEKFFIEHKIERVKELLIYNELSLTEIAYKMHYSSVAHLSSQFKKVTGNTLTHFKNLTVKKRYMLTEI